MDSSAGGGAEKKSAFRGKKSGKKVKKKQEKDGKERHNRKAFTFSGGKKSVQRKVQQSADQNARKTHAPILDKTPDIAPPYVVVVQGPRGSGKSTLIRSLVKHYTKQNISEVNGPITVVTSKHRRLTIYEAPNDIASMMDLAKIADLALCLIDASVGFEMETFEWINLLQNAGFPKVMGVLTHLDKFPETKMIRKKKKEFKARFWAEIYDGAKLFYFSGLQYGVRYLKTEVTNLARFIAVQKVPLLSWRQAHPYLVALRFEDQTEAVDKNLFLEDRRASEDQQALKILSTTSKTSITKTTSPFRKLHLYGYCYGARMRAGQFVHVCGVGDFPIASIEKYTDPCPSPLAMEVAEGKPNAELLSLNDPKRNKATGRLEKKKVNNLRTLQEKHKAIYAPGCDIGNVLMDKDAVYINLPKHKKGFTKRDDESEDEDQNSDEELEGKKASHLPEAVQLVRELQQKVGALNDVGSGSKLRLTDKARKVLANESAAGGKDKESTNGLRRRVAPDFVEGGDAEGNGKDEWKIKSGTNSDSEQEYGTSSGEEEEGSEEEDDSDKNDAESSADENDSEEETARDNSKKQFFAEAKQRFAKDIPLEELVYGKQYRSQHARNLQAGGSSSSSNGNGPKRTVDFQDAAFLATSSSSAGSVKSKSKSKSTASDQQDEDPSKPKKLSLFADDSDEDGDENDELMLCSAKGRDGVKVNASSSKIVDDGLDSWRLKSLPLDARWLFDEELRAELKKSKFVTGDWNADGGIRRKNGGAPGEGDNDSDVDMDLNDDDLDDDNVDYSKLSAEEIRERKDRIMRKKQENEENGLGTTNSSSTKANSTEHQDEFGRRNLVKKLNPNDMLEHQDAIPIGAYVRIVLENVPELSVEALSLDKPIVVGGLLPGELKMGVMQLRIKNHRWAPRVMKSNDPVFCSIGWRRFQTLPMYSLEDRNEKRMKFLKYTPEHMHCHMTFYGPVVPPKTGCIVVKNMKNIANYRVSATGLVLESNTGFQVVKKLKLTGEPYKIFKNTCFVKNMFNSDLECNKALHAKLQTVSGIRGEIKKAEGTEGHFRATFEDRLLMSDLVLLKSWVQVEPKQFYNPMLDIEDWRRMKSAGELRFEQNLQIQHKKDSLYGKQLLRQRRKFSKLQLPKSVEANLPFKTVPKNESKKSMPKPGTESRKINKAVTAVIRTDEERKQRSLLDRLNVVRKDKVKKNKDHKKQKWAEKASKEAKIQALRDAHTRNNRKMKHVKAGQAEQKKREKLRLE